MKNLLFALFALCAFGLSAQSPFSPKQRYLEAGIFFGAANYSGDLAERNIQFKESHLGYGLHARYFLSRWVALRAHFYAGSISGNDANAKAPDTRERSFRFAADILEMGLGGEWHIFGKRRFSDDDEHPFALSPYIYAGVGGTFSGTKVEYYGPPEDRDKHVVVPLPEVPRRQQFFVIPIGAGLRVNLNETVTVGLEGGFRPMLSDNLDGVRLNGNSEGNDWYYFGGATVSFVLTKPKKRF
ncbi:MAG: DUF6089 family protein [Saprospiraceae bacterium]